MLFELAYIQDGELVRGNVAASLRTVGRWIERYAVADPDRVYVAVPASPDATPLTQLKKGDKYGQLHHLPF